MENSAFTSKLKRPVARFLLDHDTGHVLTQALNRGVLTRSFKSAKYEDDLDACGSRLSELSERIRSFLVGAELLIKVDEIDVLLVNGSAFAVYQYGDRWGTTFLNCVLITESVLQRKYFANQFEMRLVRGLVGWLHSMHTGLIDIYAKDKIAQLLALPAIQRLSKSDR